MLPKEIDILCPLLLEIERRDGRARPSDKLNSKNIYESLAVFLKLTQEDLDEVTESDKRSKWENMVRFARNDLLKLGYVNNAEWGVWELTERGIEAAKIVRTFSISLDINNTNQTRHRMIALRKEIYKKCVVSGVDKEQALKIACGDDPKLILDVLGKE